MEETALVTEELLDEKIDYNFTQAKENFKSGLSLNDFQLIEESERKFMQLKEDSRLFVSKTEKHMEYKFECYYHLAEIMRIKRNTIEAIKHYKV